MAIEHPESLITRLEQLERESAAMRRSNGRWQNACLSVLVLACALPFVGWKSSKKVEAESFRLVKDGKLRAMTSVTSKGTVAYTLMDGNSKPRTILSVSQSGVSKMSFVRNGGKTIRMTLSATDSGSLALIMNDQEGKPKATLIVTSKGDGVLLLKDAAGNKK